MLEIPKKSIVLRPILVFKPITVISLQGGAPVSPVRNRDVDEHNSKFTKVFVGDLIYL